MARTNRSESICKMIHGDAEAIKAGLFSDNPYYRMDALIWLTYHRLSAPELISRIQHLKNDESALMGYTIGNYAIAALSALNVEHYNGSDTFQRELNAHIIPTAAQAQAFLAKYE